MSKLDVRDLLEVRDALNSQELKEHIDKILQMLEGNEAIEVVNHGRVIKRLVSTQQGSQPSPKEDLNAFWARIDRIAAEIGASIPDTTVDAVEIVRDVRRDL